MGGACGAVECGKRKCSWSKIYFDDSSVLKVECFLASPLLTSILTSVCSGRCFIFTGMHVDIHVHFVLSVKTLFIRIEGLYSSISTYY